MLDQDVLSTWNDRIDRICRAVQQAEQSARLRPISAGLIIAQLELAQERAKTQEIHSNKWFTDPLRSAHILAAGAPDIEQAIVAAICRAERRPEPAIVRAKAKPKEKRSPDVNKTPINAQCSYGGCDRKIRSRGYCALHYAYMRKNGKIEITRQGREWCVVAGCENHVYSKGLCQRHYELLNRTGNPLGILPFREPKSPKLCSVVECNAASKYRGMCYKHEYRSRRYGDPHASSPPKPGTYTVCRPGQKQCIIDGCDYPQVAFELCMLHYRRRKRIHKRAQRIIRNLSRPLKLRGRQNA